MKTVDNTNNKYNDEEAGAPLRDRQVAGGSGEAKRKEREQRKRPSNESAEQRQAEEASAADAKPRVSLDDLFRRTKTSPHLYWLPLTDEEVARREAERKERDVRRDQEREAREKEREQREKEVCIEYFFFKFANKNYYYF